MSYMTVVDVCFSRPQEDPPSPFSSPFPQPLLAKQLMLVLKKEKENEGNIE